MRDLTASLYRNPQPERGLCISDFPVATRETPGNVGVCLSGGGSRALTAGMGQLRALGRLQINGKSLLDQVRAISTVSGGSWLGVTFEFQAMVSDDDFLNAPLPEPQDLTAAQLGALPAGNIAGQVTKNFSAPSMALQALLYRLFSRTPADMLWQTIVAKRILAPYGLFQPGKHQAPTQAFSYDQQSIDAILKANPSLAGTRFIPLRNDDRPFLICNTSMFVSNAEPDLGDYRFLVPVQCTPFFTGVVGRPSGVDANGKTPGGGGVASFSFNSTLLSLDTDTVRVSQERPWSILDIVGSSSAFFAGMLVNLFADWRARPEVLLEAVRTHGMSALDHIEEDLGTERHAKARSWIESLLRIDRAEHDVEKLIDGVFRNELEERALHSVLEDLTLTGLVPRYRYWPVLDAAPGAVLPSEFADGGNLENTGIASLLSYRDIDNVIAFVNSATPLSPASASAPPEVNLDPASRVIRTEIQVDGQIPPLFGYQPFRDGQYVPYANAKIDKDIAWGLHNKIFGDTSFVEFLTGIWNASSGSKGAAVYRQTLAVLSNPWFGTVARDSLQCVWVYTSKVTEWESLLSAEVKQVLSGISDFPNYETVRTELSPAEINLLSSLTTWSVTHAENRALFIDLFTDD